MVTMDSDLTIVFEPAEEGGYTAYIPEIPGAVSEGETVAEARDMVLDALRELTAWRRDSALQSRSPAATIERISLAF
jgi:predicted RNase H-like HicB family nuclease